MRLYHYTLKENVFGMYKEGIRPFSYWCKSIEDCNKFLLLYMKTGVIPSSALIAYVHIDFDESEIKESFDHSEEYLGCKAYICEKRISKNRMPFLGDIPLKKVSLVTTYIS